MRQLYEVLLQGVSELPEFKVKVSKETCFLYLLRLEFLCLTVSISDVP